MNKIETTETFDNGTDGSFSLTLLEYNYLYGEQRIKSRVEKRKQTTTFYLHHDSIYSLTVFYTMYGVNKQLSAFSKEYREKIEKLPRI